MKNVIIVLALCLSACKKQKAPENTQQPVVPKQIDLTVKNHQAVHNLTVIACWDGSCSTYYISPKGLHNDTVIKRSITGNSFTLLFKNFEINGQQAASASFSVHSNSVLKFSAGTVNGQTLTINL